MQPAFDLIHPGPPSCACRCRNTGRQCTGFFSWGRCRNKGWLMLPHTTLRGLLGIFPWGVDPLATNLRTTALPVQSPTSSSFQAISSARSGQGGAQGGADRCKSLRDGGGGSRGAGGRSRGRRGAKLGMVLEERRTTEATAMMASTECGRGGETEDLPGGKKMTAQGESTA